MNFVMTRNYEAHDAAGLHRWEQLSVRRSELSGRAGGKENSLGFCAGVGPGELHVSAEQRVLPVTSKTG